jgi:hypothetical protein
MHLPPDYFNPLVKLDGQTIKEGPYRAAIEADSDEGWIKYYPSIVEADGRVRLVDPVEGQIVYGKVEIYPSDSAATTPSSVNATPPSVTLTKPASASDASTSPH